VAAAADEEHRNPINRRRGHATTERCLHVLRLVAFLQVSVADSLRREEGQTMAEYGVVLAVITLAVIGAITLLSSHVRDALTSVANILPGG
jgi:Flp pilus assembly pilin Flp